MMEAVTFAGVTVQHPSPRFVESHAPPFPEDVSTVNDKLVPVLANDAIWVAGVEPPNVMEKLSGAGSTQMFAPT